MVEKAVQSRPTLCDPTDCSLPGSSVHGILQAGILEWVAMPSSRGFSQPREQIQVSCIAGRFFTIWATREAQNRHIFPYLGNITASQLIKYNFRIMLTQFFFFHVIALFPKQTWIFKHLKHFPITNKWMD